MSNQEKSKRKKNFSGREVERLVGMIEKHHTVLTSHFNDGVTLKAKQTKWAEIALKVSSTGECIRTPDEVRKKWDDLKCSTKKKAARIWRERGITGNVPLEDIPELTEMERRILSIIGAEMVQGIPGGVDTADTQQKSATPGTSRNTTPKVRTEF